MTEERSRRVKQCRRWGGIKVPAAPSLQQLGGDSLLTELIDQEDHLFAQLKYYLEDVEVDLKSVVIIARPHLIDQVDWIDSLDSRFDGMPEIGAAELLDRLASSGYRDIVSIVRPLILI